MKTISKKCHIIKHIQKETVFLLGVEANGSAGSAPGRVTVLSLAGQLYLLRCIHLTSLLYQHT